MDLTTIGVKFGWAVEATAGTKPTSFTQLKNCKKIGGINLEADSIDTTPLEVTIRQYAQGLLDTGGTWNITFGLKDDFINAWEALLTAYETAKAANKSTWFVVWIPGMTKSCFIKAEPGQIPLSDIDVSSPLEVQTSNVINSYEGWETAIEPAAA